MTSSNLHSTSEYWDSINISKTNAPRFSNKSASTFSCKSFPFTLTLCGIATVVLEILAVTYSQADICPNLKSKDLSSIEGLCHDWNNLCLILVIVSTVVAVVLSMPLHFLLTKCCGAKNSSRRYCLLFLWKVIHIFSLIFTSAIIILQIITSVTSLAPLLASFLHSFCSNVASQWTLLTGVLQLASQTFHSSSYSQFLFLKQEIDDICTATRQLTNQYLWIYYLLAILFHIFSFALSYKCYRDIKK